MNTADVTITIDGRAVTVVRGISVAAALINDGMHTFRSSVTATSRGPLCGMGVCYECRLEIDEVAHRRACLVTVTDGQRINTGQRPRQ
ncbi:MAG: hypothetical protein JWM95_1146 [Gemmatimonadetes bacterium]|nr:hypothetical protein [Gemmatimonadota bacterium]